jgi:tetratricopeptide (TPR) repeat protein
MTRVILTFAAIPLAGACTSNAKKIESQLEAIKEGQKPETLLARGRAFARVGDYTRAEQYLAAAIDGGADPKAALPLLLRVCLVEQRYRSAIAHAEPQLNKEPEDFRLRFVVGSLYSAIGDTDSAREHLEKVVEEKPGYAEAHFALGMLELEGEEDRVAADGSFRNYLRLEPAGEHAAEARGYLLRTVQRRPGDGDSADEHSADEHNADEDSAEGTVLP